MRDRLFKFLIDVDRELIPHMQVERKYSFVDMKLYLCMVFLHVWLVPL